MTYEDATKFPLCWPDNWPRSNPSLRGRSKFSEHTITQGFNELAGQMKMLGGENWFLSSNIPRSKRNEAPIGGGFARLSDPGVSVWFKRKGKSLSMACDRWLRVEDNIWSIAKSVEAIRGIERWGASEIMERAFRGFAALPGIGESGGGRWWDTLGVPVNATTDQVKEAYRILAKKHHPDVSKNGDRDNWDRIAQAWDQFQQTQKL
jgi:hypothetical protein